jgi:hypothetical protein
LTVNIFIFSLLEPLNRMTKTIIQTLSDWELHPEANSHQRGEIETLGEFFHLTMINQFIGIYNRRTPLKGRAPAAAADADMSVKKA